MKITKQAMEISKAQEVIKSQTAMLLADPGNEELQTVLKTNMDSVDRISKAVMAKDATLLPSSMVEIEVAEKDDSDVPSGALGILTTKMDSVLTALAGLNKGDTPPAGDPPAAGSEPGAGDTPPAGDEDIDKIIKGVALDIAVEVINGYSQKLQTLKATLESGSEVTKDDMKGLFGWEVREAVESAVTAANIAKSDDTTVTKAKDLLIDALTKNDEPADGKTPPAPAATPDPAPEADLGKGADDDAGDSWIDLSPPLEDPTKTK